MRGEIRERQYAQRLRDFTGLRYGKCTPTDIDGFLEFDDRLFVFIEAKFGASPLSYGQRLALGRLCDACHKPPGRVATVLLAGYDYEVTDVDYAAAEVLEYRWGGAWRTLGGQTVREVTDKLRAKYL